MGGDDHRQKYHLPLLSFVGCQHLKPSPRTFFILTGNTLSKQMSCPKTPGLVRRPTGPPPSFTFGDRPPSSHRRVDECISI